MKKGVKSGTLKVESETFLLTQYAERGDGKEESGMNFQGSQIQKIRSNSTRCVSSTFQIFLQNQSFSEINHSNDVKSRLDFHSIPNTRTRKKQYTQRIS